MSAIIIIILLIILYLFFYIFKMQEEIERAHRRCDWLRDKVNNSTEEGHTE